jgi:exosortase
MFRRHLGFLVFVVASALIFWTPLTRLISFSLTRDYGSHIIFVVPASAYLIYLRRREIFSKVRTNLFTGSTLFLTGALSWWPAHLYSPLNSDYFSLEIIAIVVLWMSGFIFFYGTRTFRTARFPLLFLVLLVPIPDFLLGKITFFLQSGSATVAYWLLRISDVSVFKEGFLLRFPTLDIEVTNQCSGIRSSLALLITTLLVGEFLLHSVWRKSLLVLSILPIVILKNAVRIVTISWLTIHVDRGFLQGRLHTSGGIVFYLLGLLALAPIVVLFRRSETRMGIVEINVPVLLGKDGSISEEPLRQNPS